VTYPDEPLRSAVDAMLQHDVGRLPVVSRENPKQVLGMIGRASVMIARSQVNELETVRESVWTRAAANGNGNNKKNNNNSKDKTAGPNSSDKH
jgi:hypothetical protein